MCGRFTLRTPVRRVAEIFDLPDTLELLPHYNIAPTQQVPVVRANPDSGRRELVLLHWGLIPPWADDPSIGNRMINARAETLSTKRAFRDAFRSRRCLVVSDGFYEWRRRGRKKQPYYITRSGGEPLALAGLWERWSRDDARIESCTIVTTDANDLVRPLHDRMPLVIEPRDFDLWLDPQITDPQRLESLLKPFPADELTLHPVGARVNDPRHDSPDCIQSVEPAEPQRSGWLFDVD